MIFLKFIEKIPDKIIPSLKQRNYALYVLWREICHIIGSLILLYVSYLITPKTVPVTFILLTIWMTYQEFYFHPKKYDQPLWKGLIDWLSWITPFIIYFLLTKQS